ncbi:MAG: radical SAM protein [Phascolarctobacterium sp.]|nr:radical SAM protein [Phascolarctobacterium sp.]
MAIIPIFIPHAGCPHQCVFCNQKTISGQRTAAVEGAKEQIKKWLEWVKPSVENEAAFYGGSFTGLDIALQKELLALTDQLRSQKIIGSVRLSTRPDYIDAERLALLREHGVQLVELGVQSLDDEVLIAAERGHTAEQVAEAVSLLKEYGLKVGVQLMVGMPKQGFASVKETVEQVVQLQPDVGRIYPLLVIQGTPLAKSYERGEFVPLTLEEAVRQSAYVYKKLSVAGVKIIRVGLQADDELCAEGNILAGPFHPSMGELVQSYLLREELTPQILQAARDGEGVIISCPRKLESKLRGLRNSNVIYWRELVAPKELTIKNAEVSEIKITFIPSNDLEKAATQD